MADFVRRAWLQTLSQVPAVPRQIYERFPQALWVGNPQRREIALTYDDGPDLQDTPQLLAVLARYNVTATFCLIGERVEALPELVAAIAAEGHQIGLHGYRHRAFVLDQLPALHERLEYTRRLIATVANCDPGLLRYVRPPYGLFTPALLQSLIAWGYRPIIGSIVPVHWSLPLEQTVSQIMRYVQPGSLLVLHESLGGVPIAQITNELIPRLEAANFKFVTIDQMWESRLSV